MQNLKLAVPNRVWFSLTGRCNNSCSWCYRSGSEISDFIGVSFVKKITEVLSDCGTRKCTIIGGEPTLHKDYKGIIDFLCGKMESCTLVTNGRALSGGIPKEWGGYSNLHVVVSLHGANEDHYAVNTGQKSGFHQAINAINGLLGEGIRHSVNIVLSKENLPFINEFIRVVKKTKANLLCFTIAMSSIDDPFYKTYPLEISQHIEEIHNMCEATKQKHMFIFSLPWCILEPRILES